MVSVKPTNHAREKTSNLAHPAFSCDERTHVRHDDRAPLSEPGGVDSGLFVMLEVCIESLNVSNRDCGYLSSLSMALEAVILQHLHRFLGPRCICEIHKRISNVGHCAQIQRNIQEIKGAAKTEAFQLVDQFTLAVTIWHIANHDCCHCANLPTLCVLLCEIDSLGDLTMPALLW